MSDVPELHRRALPSGEPAPDIPNLRDLSSSRKVMRGARYALAGVRLVAFQPSLWGYLVAPVSIMLLLFFGGAFFAWHGIGLALGMLWTPGAGASAMWAGAWWLLGIFVKLMAVGTLALGLYFTAGLIATPFNDRLSEHVETSVLGPYEEPFSWRVLVTDLLISVTHSVVSLTIWITVMVFSFVLNLIPGIGSVASFVIGTVATAMFLSREAADGCMSRRRMSFGHKFRVVMQHSSLFFGFGVVASCMLWIPFLNFLLLPMAVAGGTLMYCHLEQQGLIPDEQGSLGYVPTRTRVAALADHGAERDGFGEFAHEREREALHV
jgi:CysZ protein